MSIILAGLNHQTAPAELRERLTLTGCALPMALEEFGKASPPEGGKGEARLHEGVILSTPSRFELYAVADDRDDKWKTVEDYLQRLQGIPAEQLRAHLYRLEDREALEHLMRVAAGVDATVVGEPQILGQVVEAFREAQASKTVGLVLSQVFSRAIRVGKRVRTETDIGRHTTSVSHAGVRKIEEKLGDISGLKIVLIGAGEMARLAGGTLVEKGAADITVMNRTHSRSKALAEQIGAKVLNWLDIYEALKSTDVVFCATDAPHPVILAGDVEQVIAEREGRTLMLVDIALPRDVEPGVGALEGVELCDMDDLNALVSTGIEQRLAAFPQIEKIVEEEVQNYDDWLQRRDVTPVIVDLKKNIQDVIEHETAEALRRVSDPNLQDVIRRLSHRFLEKILHEPTIRLKEHAASGEGVAYADAIREIFALDDRPGERRRRYSDMKSRKIVVTRAAHQADGLMQLLRDRGAMPLSYPCIAIEPAGDDAMDSGLRRAVRGEFDWIVFTSPNTVWAVRERMETLGLEARALGAAKIAAVGPATALALATLLGLDVGLVPDDHDAESLAKSLAPVTNARIFLPQSRIARPVLSETLAAAGADVTAVAAYDTVIGSGGADVPGMLGRKEIDAVTFTSSSTVGNFLTRLEREGGDKGDLDGVCVACLGRPTADTARELGLSVTVQPPRSTLDDMVSTLERYFEKGSGR